MEEKNKNNSFKIEKPSFRSYFIRNGSTLSKDEINNRCSNYAFYCSIASLVILLGLFIYMIIKVNI